MALPDPDMVAVAVAVAEAVPVDVAFMGSVPLTTPAQVELGATGHSSDEQMLCN